MADTNFQSEIIRKFAKNYPLRIFPYKPPANWRKANPIAEKFYSAHKELNPRIVSEEELEDDGLTPADFRPTQASKIETFNQEYGLHLEPLLKLDRNDRRFFKPKCSCEVTRIEEIIRRGNPQ